jgi:predicted ATPase
MGSQPPTVEPVDWATFLSAFKGWSARLIQVFANLSRPLIIIVDDIQWISADEVEIWRSLTDGMQPVNHVMLVTIFRIARDTPPPLSALLSVSGESLHVKHLPEEGVKEYLEASFSGGVDGHATLAQFLFAETLGSPLYLRSMIETLVSLNEDRAKIR